MIVLKTAIPIFFLMVILACAPHNAAHRPLFEKLTDTVNYLQTQVIDQKSRFVGQPMSVLLKKISIPFKSFISVADISHLEVSSCTHFYFEDTQTATLHSLNREHKPWLYIVWKKPINMDSTTRIARKYQGNWSDETAIYFGKQVVKDILLYQ